MGIKTWFGGNQKDSSRDAKIFCISFQRNGTKSTGQFFRDHGYSVARARKGRELGWTLEYFKGNYQAILRSSYFKSNQVFEDDPWWIGEFYKILFHEFPDSKFVLFDRDPDKWFNSMMKHSNGRSLGNTHRHSIVYDRLTDFYCLPDADERTYTMSLDNMLPLTDENREKYIHVYTDRNREVKNFFKKFGEERIFISTLENSSLWTDLGSFLGIDVAVDYSAHENKTKSKV
jgi:hypothetical protein